MSADEFDELRVLHEAARDDDDSEDVEETSQQKRWRALRQRDLERRAVKRRPASQLEALYGKGTTDD